MLCIKVSPTARANLRKNRSNQLSYASKDYSVIITNGTRIRQLIWRRKLQKGKNLPPCIGKEVLSLLILAGFYRECTEESYEE